MPQLVVLGAKISCTMAIPPAPVGTLTVLPTNKTMGDNVPAATIMDQAPFVNIAPFPMCQAPANPAVIAATAAAMGTPTPSTCIPTFPGPWTPGCSKVMIGNMPALSSSSTLQCAYGGTVQIAYAGQAKIDAS